MRANVVVLCVALLALGCAGVDETRRSPDAEDTELEEDRQRLHRRHPERMPRGTVILPPGPGKLSRQAVEMGLLDVDAFEKLLVRAGLEDLDELPIRHNPFTPEDAVEVLGRLMQKPVTLGTFPTRMAAGFLLREVLEQGDVSREELVRRVARFAREQVAVLRPDGYLAWALDGSTQQKVAPVEWKGGAFRAGRFELGRFYSGRGGVFRTVDARLRSVEGPPLAEVYDDADVINRSLDGAEDAFVELYHALGQLLSHPADSIAGLSHLPSAVVALIASSPAYWERFQSMTEGEQIREVARLTTGLLVTCGAASATTRTLTGMMAGAEASVPVLSLSAQGALAVERVAVPVGRAAAVLGGGPGAAIILQRTNTATGQPQPPDEHGPGKWGPSEEKGASKRARAYQEQISGRSYDDAYWVGGVGKGSGGVKFDGFKNRVLLEAKGLGYAEFFERNLAPKSWYRNSGKAQDLIDQALRQSEKALATGTAIEWHVAERHAADSIRKLIEGAGVKGIDVIHTPAF